MEEKEFTISNIYAEIDEREKVSHSVEKKTKKAKKSSSKKKKDEIKPLKPVFQYANIVYTSIAFFGTAILLIVLPRSETSEIEQRNLAEFPEYSSETFIDGEYTNGITEYFGDTVPFRDELKKLGSKLRGFYGVSYDDSEIYGKLTEITKPVTTEKPPESEPLTTSVSDGGGENSPEAAETSAPVETTTAQQTTEPASTEKGLNEIAPGVMTNGQVVTKLSDGHWWAISLYGGGAGDTYAATLNRFREELDDSVRLYNMVVPTAGEYYLPDKYDAYSASHQESIDMISSKLSEGITEVPAAQALWAHTDEPIYTRTDHHWQPLGAYYAAQTMAEAAGVPFGDISAMNRVDIEGYVGTMYSFTGENPHLLEDPETFTYYKPTNSYTTYYYNTEYGFDYEFPFFIDMPVGSSYSTFMGGDKKIVRIKTDVGNGRKLLIFKDSYGNAEIPFYFGSFEDIYVCDMRYFDLNPIQFINEMGVTDVLFTMCTFSAVGPNANTFAKLLDNPVREEISEPVSE